MVLGSKADFWLVGAYQCAGRFFFYNNNYYKNLKFKILIKINNSEVQFSPKNKKLFENFLCLSITRILIWRNLIEQIWGGVGGLEIIVTRYMPWWFGKVPCTYIAHNLRFFDKYQCEYISSQVLTMHALVWGLSYFFLGSFQCGWYCETSACTKCMFIPAFNPRPLSTLVTTSFVGLSTFRPNLWIPIKNIF